MDLNSLAIGNRERNVEKRCITLPTVLKYICVAISSCVNSSFLILLVNKRFIYTVFQKSDAKIQITITMAHLIRINYPLSSFNYHLSGTNVAKFNKIHHIVSEQQLLKKMELKNRIFQYGKYRLGYLLQKVLLMT